MNDTQNNTNTEHQQTDSDLLERLVVKAERDETTKIEDVSKIDELKETKAKDIHSWLDKTTSTLRSNTCLDPVPSKFNVKLHVGIFEEDGTGRLTHTYIIKVRIVNDEDDYMIEKISYDWRGLASTYHREIDTFNELREYLLKDVSREIAFARKHDELAVYEYPQATSE